MGPSQFSTSWCFFIFGRLRFVVSIERQWRWSNSRNHQQTSQSRKRKHNLSSKSHLPLCTQSILFYVVNIIRSFVHFYCVDWSQKSLKDCLQNVKLSYGSDWQNFKRKFINEFWQETLTLSTVSSFSTEHFEHSRK